jgi:hypothetical protein
MSRKLGISLAAAAAILAIGSLPAMAQTRSGGNRGGQAYNNPPQPASPFDGNQAQPGYPPEGYQQQPGYSNGHQDRRGPQNYGGSYSDPRGNSYASPDYRSYGPSYRGWNQKRAWRERMWRERMWRERNRYRGAWGR